MSEFSAGAALPGATRHPLRVVIDNVAAGVRLACGHSPGAHAFQGGLVQALIALLLNWLLVIAVERVSAGADTSPSVWGFVAEGTRMYLWLGALAVLALLCRAATALPRMVIGMAYASMVIWGVCRALEFFTRQYAPDIDAPYTPVFYACTLAWSGLVCLRLLIALEAGNAVRRLGAAVIYAGALYAIQHSLPDAPMFYRAEESPPQLDVEGIYYAQDDLLAHALEQLTPQIPHETDLYFLGLGVYGDQDVFMHEALAVRDVMESRLGLRGHTLMLVNNAETVATYPLANRHNLERALAGIGATMDRDEDIAVVFLTSHGYEDGAVSAEFAQFAQNDIEAADVRDALDDAGIRWRVVIVSACYSGNFVDELKSPESVVITAAARDRSSFGCAAEADWTYFGRAYFADALTRTGDFLTAFTQASEAIAARETREGKTASNPQIWIGDAARAQLERWTRERAGRQAATQPSESR